MREGGLAWRTPLLRGAEYKAGRRDGDKFGVRAAKGEAVEGVTQGC